MFSPPAIPQANPAQWVFEVTAREPLPWSEGHPLRSRRLTKAQAWRHTVYLGTYPRESVFTALSKVFPSEVDSFEERPLGSSALLAFVVSEDGVMLEGSAVLSACAWATGRALDPGPASADWLDGFAELERDFAASVRELALDREETLDGAAPLDWPALTRLRDMAADVLDVARVLAADGIRVRSEVVAKRTASVVEHDFLNSFIADDLARVAAAAKEGEVGAALRDYMRSTAELDIHARVDVRAQLDEVRRATDPNRVPLGRWPASPARPLALGQQLAVNEAFAMPHDAGRLFTVNGPPGTGKTTMLRELIAALVTERAERLAVLSDPSDAFTGETHRWKTTRYQRVVHELRPELTGFELVVASSNNGAVENVTLELPSGEAIDAVWREHAGLVGYFSALAERAMRAGRRKSRGARRASDQAAWALIAARLGNRKNRRDFVNAVWWPERRKDVGADRKTGADAGRKTGADAGDAGDRSPPEPGLRDLLAAWEAHADGVSWAEAVAAFERARDRAAAIRDERLHARAALDRLSELEAELETAREAERIAGQRVAASRERRGQLRDALRKYEEERRRRIKVRAGERRRRPRVLQRRTRAEWRARDKQLASEISAVEALLRQITGELAELEQEANAHARANAAAAAIGRELDECNQVLERIREQLGNQLPDGRWRLDREERERRAPWADAEWNRARTELFLAALSLHRALIVHAAQQMRESLDGAMEIVSGNAPSGLPEEVVLAAWQTLFLVVPVVSTTFASVSRLFGSLRAEALGWLLIDEAGQAAPQNALGALWRCQRAVIVGDPLQLEPITTIPFAAEQAIRMHYGVDEQWLTSRDSVQSIADRLNRLGTALPGGDGLIWVGAPLAVHRRCDQPMFDLSNAIAYDGLMLHATDPALSQAFTAQYPTLPQSKWIDVPSSTSQGHWIPAEGAELDRILAHLDAIGLDLARVMAITPFRDVARRLHERARRHPRLTAGTIHTAQGKEADIVILLLGSDPARDGARSWAASKPNLLNVAVSRARRRLYVIGDRDAWMRHRYFSVLADRLPYDQAPATDIGLR